MGALGDHRLVCKWLMYDCITRIPLVTRDFRGDGEVGSTDDLVSLTDLGPTIWTAGYKQKRLKQYSMNWTHDGRAALNHSQLDARLRPVDL
ncbi:MAG TPA: hypothetical protein QF604_21865 [Candidatus Latescibacteria bacterium]|jgi:hypothetical protein|nr:hypothetical protein [Chloroflexota bacterium]MDP7362913.1 hypothetical protein [Candidatus Latescibacterota bacterium]HJN30562.1 hypothetical protein [Candidatus Latescibacterota bacterium]